MRDSLGCHHHDFALDQLELLVLADDAGFDHATDVLDGECPTRETFGSCGGSKVHAGYALVTIATIARGAVQRTAAKLLVLARARSALWRAMASRRVSSGLDRNAPRKSWRRG